MVCINSLPVILNCIFALLNIDLIWQPLKIFSVFSLACSKKRDTVVCFPLLPHFSQLLILRWQGLVNCSGQWHMSRNYMCNCVKEVKIPFLDLSVSPLLRPGKPVPNGTAPRWWTLTKAFELRKKPLLCQASEMGE